MHLRRLHLKYRHHSIKQLIAYYLSSIIGVFSSIFLYHFVIDFMKDDSIADSKEIIVWEDKAVEAAIKGAMYLSIDDEVSVSAVHHWFDSADSTLILEGEEIEKLEDLKYLTGLKKLVLKNTNVVDLTPLQNMKKLSILEIYAGKINNIEVLGELESLFSLSLYDIPIHSIQALSQLNDLSFLKLGGIPLDDLSVFRQTKKLSMLTLERMPITDISALMYLRSLIHLEIISVPIEVLPILSNSLEYIGLKNTNVSDVSVIPSSVEKLSLEYNQKLDINSLYSLIHLTSLHIEGIELSEMRLPLSFPELEELYISGAHLSSINCLGDCPKLYYLDLQNNEIEIIEGIEKFELLQYLILSDNKLQEINGIDKLPHLLWLNLSENPVKDLTPLGKVHSLERLELSGIDLKDICLENLLNSVYLEVLHLVNCGLKDIKFIKKFHHLQELVISNNQVSNIDEIKYMTATEESKDISLDLSYNPVEDLTPLQYCGRFNKLNLSGINLNTVKGINVFHYLDIYELMAENCGLKNLDALKILGESKVYKLDLSNNELKELSLFIEDEWNIHELDVSGNCITDEYMAGIGAFKISPELYQYKQASHEIELSSIKIKI